MTTHADAARFLAEFFGPRTTAPVFVTSLANDRDQSTKIFPRQIITRKPDEIERFAAKWDQPERALYFCVATILIGTHKRSKDTVAELTGLHCDCDFKSIDAEPPEIEQTLARLPLLPQRVNFSGHGFHGFWLFPKALPATFENKARVEAALHRLADVVAGDSSVCEVSRLMRLPGSHNSKFGEWVEVRTVAERPGGYELEELEEWLATAVPVLRRRAPDKGNGHSADNPFETLGAEQTVKPAIDVEPRLAAMQYRGPDDTAIHLTQLSVTAALLGRGLSIDAVVAKVLEATQVTAGPEGTSWNWKKEEADLRAMCESWIRKHPDIITITEDVADSEADAIAAKAPNPDPVVVDHDREPAQHKAAAAAQGTAGVTLADFHSYMPTHAYIYAPTREPWPASSVNARIAPIAIVDKTGKPVVDKNGKRKTSKATAWLDQHKPVEQLTWAPGHPVLVRNRLVAEGGWIPRNKVTTFNLYRPPILVPGNANKAELWLAHVRKIYPEDAEHLIRWLAQRVQHPEIKINHALVLGGPQGIGKDSMLEPVKRAVGPWNFNEVSPTQIMGRFNGFLKSVILRINEARDLGDVNRYQFYEHLKPYTAAPPDTLRVDEKHLREHSIFNCCGVVITTNYKTDGIYLPADDRRHYVAWSDLHKQDFPDAYWRQLWGWYDAGGDRHVAAYLMDVNLTKFDPKAPPLKTAAFWAIADANVAPEASELADVLDIMKNPDVVTIAQIRDKAIGDFEAWISDRKNRRTIPHRMENCGYVPVRNADAKDGFWAINAVRQVIYAKSTLSSAERLKAAHKLMSGEN